MASITLKGNPVQTVGTIPQPGTKAPDFSLWAADLKRVTLANYAGKKKIVSIFPSIDTPVCAKSVREFNQAAARLDNVVVLNIAADLPFAFKRFCAAEGITSSETLSTFGSSFAQDWQVAMAGGPMAGLCSRAVVVLDANNLVRYAEQVPEIVQEPNYAAALAAVVE